MSKVIKESFANAASLITAAATADSEVNSLTSIDKLVLKIVANEPPTGVSLISTIIGAPVGAMFVPALTPVSVIAKGIRKLALATPAVKLVASSDKETINTSSVTFLSTPAPSWKYRWLSDLVYTCP